MKVRLGDVFSVIRNGASIKQKDGAIGYPITRIETISERYVNRNKLGYADIINIAKYNKFILEDEDILMSHINSEKHLAKVALYKRKQGETIIHGMNLLMLRADRQYIAPSYAVLLFESNRFLNTIKTISKKSVNQASFTVTALKDIVIQLPDLKIQEKIANQINAVSHSISLQKKCVLLLEQLVKSRFIETFGDIHHEEKFKGIELGDICKTVSGGTPSSKYAQYFNGTIPWITTTALGPNHIGKQAAKIFITNEAVMSSATHLIPPNSVLVGTRVGVGKTSVTDVSICTNQDIVALTDIDVKRYNSIFIKYSIDQYQNHFNKIKKGATILGIATQDLKQILIPIVKIEIQNEFAAFVEKVDKSKFIVGNRLAGRLYRNLLTKLSLSEADYD